ncbi:hypothetical protein JYG23_00250 [Sedimentibacter sp. zth1]|uniref:hypothetical protein n=1 Tax=Sedimentibacter sp. zth1 TaxID=2816908 RepID=UPI001A923731|nr:hypothetical protein [Sedimentibacter sp. zth1]QSX05935.1 hypothetical protein JYG23_00250 [Sedimentibacter sp. zth1]
MKKIFVLLIILTLTLSLFTACTNKITELKMGKYTLVMQENNEIPDVMLPCITLTDEQFTFVYDSLSSYFNIGTYKITDEILMLTTSDKKYTYSFKIDGDSLIFIEDKSDSVGLIDSKFGVQVLDGSEFKLTE